MEITYIGKNSIKLKGKGATLAIDPQDVDIKTSVNAVLFLSRSRDSISSKIENLGIIIKGEGEYEIMGVKISAMSSGDDILYKIIMDNVSILIGKGSIIEKLQDKIDGSQVVVINKDAEVKPSLLTALECYLAIIYNVEKEDLSQLGEVIKQNKVVFTSDKLPAEMQIVALQ